MSAPDQSDANKRSPLLLIGAAFTAMVLLIGAGAWLMLGDRTPPPRRVPEPIVVRLIPPPPPPPPPPVEQKPPEPEMIEQQKMVEPEVKEQPLEEQPKEADNNDEPPPGPLALDSEAQGPGDAMGLGANPNGRGLLSGRGRSKWGWYASMVQAEIESALRSNAKTRNSMMQVQLRLWADSSGRISRVQIVSSTGTAELNAVLQSVVLGGLRLREGPPGDMPMPMVTRITVRKAS